MIGGVDGLWGAYTVGAAGAVCGGDVHVDRPWEGSGGAASGEIKPGYGGFGVGLWGTDRLWGRVDGGAGWGGLWRGHAGGEAAGGVRGA